MCADCDRKWSILSTANTFSAEFFSPSSSTRSAWASNIITRWSTAYMDLQSASCGQTGGIRLAPFAVFYMIIWLPACYIVAMRQNKKHYNWSLCTPCLKNGTHFIFWITQKLTDFNEFWYMKSWKILHQQLMYLPTSPVNCSHFPLGNPKKIIFQQYYSYVLLIICVISD